jgi:hypothetical protein
VRLAGRRGGPCYHRIGALPDILRADFSPAVAAAMIVLAVAVAPAAADQAPGESGDALPGMARVGVPVELERGVAVSVLAGYGFTESVLDEGGDAHHRATTTLGASFRPKPWLGLGVKLDARWDRHHLDGGSDQTFVSDPRLYARVVGGAGAALRLGAEAVVWVPGDSPAQTRSAVDGASVDLVGLVSYPLDGWTFAGNAGFRIDRSAASVTDRARVGDSDRLTLGVADANAMLLGAAASRRLGPVEVLGEWSWDLLVGKDAPRAIVSPMRLSAGVRYRASPLARLDLRFDASPQRRPLIGPGDPFVPVEPLVAVMVGMTVRFPSEALAGAGRVEHAGPVAEEPPAQAPPAPGEGRTLRGRVLGDGGDPIERARVQVSAGARLVVVTTGADGTFVAGQLPPAQAEVFVEADGFASRTVRVAMSRGEVVDMDFVLETRHARGELRGVVISLRGEPIRAKISIDALGIETITDADGAFAFQVPAGTHELKVEAPEYRPQQRRVEVEDGGVTVLNVDDMHKVRRKR